MQTEETKKSSVEESRSLKLYELEVTSKNMSQTVNIPVAYNDLHAIYVGLGLRVKSFKVFLISVRFKGSWCFLLGALLSGSQVLIYCLQLQLLFLGK